ncbi:TetR/AcrR family transcriptional regulator [Amycolatopsis acidicola]|uniref:TetR/AcrR family transcriptional regulator n=1 Tax=Amycolatopsis acidicola TaxID=2596893 RepID=A0A5N0V389_9PSEU|nr:TetR family transcriptional regulator [Amycolatopsis acidicola]KAA9158091.1 TetR/AcrR family transcriptional regulator [Amycolatopsis acidicola]
MANLRAAQKEMTRGLLLSTALELFEAQGYAATKIDDIARAAGTTRVTFYAHFSGRSDLMRALIARLNELLERSDDAGHHSTSDALVAAVREGERAGLDAWLRAQSARWPEIRPYVLSAFEAAAVDPELRGLVYQWFEEVIDDIERGLTEAGRFAPDSRRARGVLAMAQLDHLAQRWMRHGWDIDGDQALALLADSWAHLLAD